MAGKMIFNKTSYFVLCILLAGCAASSNLSQDAREQIVGIYKYIEPLSPETILELREDFSYRMCYVGPGSEFGKKTRLVDGKWEYSKGSVILNYY